MARAQMLRQWQGRQFRARELASSERVYWTFPFPRIEYPLARDEDIKECKDDQEHRYTREIRRLVGVFRADFMRSLEEHERRYNKGCMPQVSVQPRRPRCVVEKYAMLIVMDMLQRVFIDATEETPLLHPGEAPRG